MEILKNNLSNRLILIFSLLFLLLISLSAVNAAETNITSSDNLGGTIQNASNGDTINLDTGTYTNNVTNIKIDKNLTIQGKNPKTTTIDAQHFGRIFNITTGNTLTLINITLINGNATQGGAIYNNGSLKITNSILANNTGAFGGAIACSRSENLTINNSTFSNNIATEYGGAIAIEAVSNFIVNNSIFNNNEARFGGGAIATFFIINNMTVSNSIFTNNKAEVDFGGAIFNSFFVNLRLNAITSPIICNIINSSFTNNTAGLGGGAISHSSFTGGLSIDNSSFINNTANEGGAIYQNPVRGGLEINNSAFINNKIEAVFSYGNTIISNSNFTNNILAIFIASYSNITGCNIINNTQGILIDEFAFNSSINYNRIFNNTDYDLNNTGIETNADYNWWGNNTPTKILGIIPNNYFVMNVTNLTSTVTNGSAKFNYTFGLNTNDPFNASLLPYFVTNVYTNITSGIQQTFDARFNRTVTVDTDKGGQNVTYTFITDNEVKNISLFVEPIPTNLEVNNPTGKNGETVNLTAKLTDKDGNPLEGKLIIFHVAGMTLTAITGSNGIATVQYTINKDDFTNRKLAFTATFEGDENYLASSNTGTVTLIEEPEPPEPEPEQEEQEEQEEANEIANAEMKETGIPINLILITLVSVLGVLISRKQ